MRNIILTSLFALLLGPAFASAQDVPAAKPNLSPMRLVKLKAITFLYATIPFPHDGTTAAAIHDQVVAIEAAMKPAGIWPAGPTLIIFHGIDPPKPPTTIDVGFPVAQGTTAIGGFQVAQLDSALEATAVYSGPVGNNDIGRLYSQIIASGHTPSDVMRQRMLYFESEGSPNNVTLIEIPLEN
jgi:hypothetical protein